VAIEINEPFRSHRFSVHLRSVLIFIIFILICIFFTESAFTSSGEKEIQADEFSQSGVINYTEMVIKPFIRLALKNSNSEDLSAHEQNVFRVIEDDLDNDDDEMGFKRVILMFYGLKDRSIDLSGEEIKPLIENAVINLVDENTGTYLHIERSVEALNLPESSGLKDVIQYYVDFLTSRLRAELRPFSDSDNSGTRMTFFTKDGKDIKIRIYTDPEEGSVSEYMDLEIKNKTTLTITEVTTEKSLKKTSKKAQKRAYGDYDWVSSHFRDGLSTYMEDKIFEIPEPGTLDSIPVLKVKIHDIVLKIPLGGELLAIKTNKQGITLFPGYSVNVFENNYSDPNSIPSLIKIPFSPSLIGISLSFISASMKSTF